MKHFALFLLFFLTSMLQVVAQRKWELGLTVRGGTYTKAFDQTELMYHSNLESKSISRGMTTSLGLYAQRRLTQSLSFSAGLAYTLNQYDLQRNTRQLVYEPFLDQSWKVNAVEHSVSAPVQLHLNWSRWSFSAGPTFSYHLTTRLQSSYIITSAPITPGIIWCGTGMYWMPDGAADVQVFGSGALEYSFNGSTRLGISALISFKKNEMDYNGSYLSAYPKWSSDSRLSIFPRNLAVSLRHNLLK